MVASLPKLKKAALLVIDKQNAYTKSNEFLVRFPGNKSSPFDEILPKVDSFIKLCRTRNILIVWTRMIEDPDSSPTNIAQLMKASDAPTISREGSKSFEINGLKPRRNEKVITKQYYDAFSSKELVEYLQSKGIDTVILVGGFASRCILATAFGANSHNYNLIVAKDLVGNPDRIADELPIALQITESILGRVLDSKDIEKLL